MKSKLPELGSSKLVVFCGVAATQAFVVWASDGLVQAHKLSAIRLLPTLPAMATVPKSKFFSPHKSTARCSRLSTAPLGSNSTHRTLTVLVSQMAAGVSMIQLSLQSSWLDLNKRGISPHAARLYGSSSLQQPPKFIYSLLPHFTWSLFRAYSSNTSPRWTKSV